MLPGARTNPFARGVTRVREIIRAGVKPGPSPDHGSPGFGLTSGPAAGESRSARIRIEDVVLLDRDVVVVGTRSKRSAQSTGLNAVSPLNRSMPIEKSFEKKICSLRPKNSELFGCAVLTPLGVGKRPRLELEKIVQGEVEENVLADNRARRL